MSGHSKFANIKHKKEKNDAAKGKIFTIIGREIAVAVKEGGSDPANNYKLAQVIAKAKANNMPNDTIDRGIKKAAGEGNNVNYEYCTYEGYGPSGTAIIVNALTDNRNRTASDMRHYFDKFGGNLGQTGCVSYLFEDKGHIIIVDEDEKIDEEHWRRIRENGREAQLSSKKKIMSEERAKANGVFYVASYVCWGMVFPWIINHFLL